MVFAFVALTVLGQDNSTYRVVHQMLLNEQPQLAYEPTFTVKKLHRWKKQVSKSVEKLVLPPMPVHLSAPVCIESIDRGTYLQEKWSFEILKHNIASFYVLIPKIQAKSRAAFLCIPGSGMTKEDLIGTSDMYRNSPDNYKVQANAMALHYVKNGYVSVAVEQPSAGEMSDRMEIKDSRSYNYEYDARVLLELGWSYLGYTVYLDKFVLDWMKTDHRINPRRIMVSGFSLGTEVLMMLGALDKLIYGFVYNDFLCRTKERAEVMTKITEGQKRSFPNSIRHLVPRFWNYFDFPDLVAALAPRPLILTEGGLDRDLDLIRHVYSKYGAMNRLEIHHYQKFENQADRTRLQRLPDDIDRDEYYRLVNVDGRNHYFKVEYVLPWVNRIFNY